MSNNFDDEAELILDRRAKDETHAESLRRQASGLWGLLKSRMKGLVEEASRSQPLRRVLDPVPDEQVVLFEFEVAALWGHDLSRLEAYTMWDAAAGAVRVAGGE